MDKRFYSCIAPSISLNDSYFPIVRKGTRACTQQPTANYVCYDSLSPEFRAFLVGYFGRDRKVKEKKKRRRGEEENVGRAYDLHSHTMLLFIMY